MVKIRRVMICKLWTLWNPRTRVRFLPEEELNDESKFHKLRIPLRICILGVDGLEHEALNEIVN